MFRIIYLLVCFLLFSPFLYAAECIDIFPKSPMPYELLPSDKHFTNVPDNTSNQTLVDGSQLVEGDNFYKKSSVSDRLKVTVSDLNESRSARLYINDSVVWVNVKINKEGDPEDLIIYVNGALQISGDETEINAIIYATGSIAISGKADMSGAISSQSNISISNEVELEYDDDNIEDADFTGMCLPELEFELLADFHFDECGYTGAVGEVIDQTGNFSGSAHSGVNTNTIGQINRFAELTNSNHHIETSIPLPEDFSISTWFKKPTSTSGSRYFVLGGMNGGGDLMYIDRENEWRWGVYNLSGATIGKYSFEKELDNEWHHLMLVYDDDETKLYIDGELVDTIDRSVSGTLKYIGTSNDSINDTSNEQGFRAPLDEFIVFEGELTEDDIEIIYDNQSNKFNYDESSRDPISCSAPTLLGLYRFEQNSLESQVDDSSNYHNHGTNIDGQVIAQGKYCRGFDSNGVNSNNTTKHAFSSNLNLVNDIGVKGTISFWFNSNTQWNKGGHNNTGDRTLFDATLDRGKGTGNKYFTLGIRSNGLLRFSFEDSKDKDFYIEEPNNIAIRNANKWYYVTATWDFSHNQFGLYVDGQSRLQRKRRTSKQIKSLGEVIFGDNASTYSDNNHDYLPSNFSANGKFDEVRIYNVVLSEIEIQKDMNETFGCPEFDHFEIDTIDGEGLTCQTDNIIIKACADSTCSVLNNDSHNVELFVNGVSNLTLKVVGGSTATNYDYISAGKAELSLDQPYQCKDSTSTTCDVTFKDSGFIFGNVDDDILAIPTQLSGKPSNIGFKAKKIFLQAVATNETTGACDDVFPEGGDIPVKLSYSCIAGSKCTDELLINNGTSIVAIKLDSAPAVEVTLSFTTDSKAYFHTLYPDAGKLALNAQKNIEVEDNNGDKVTKVFEGKSNDFVVRPFAFKLYFDPLVESNAVNAISQDTSGNADPSIFTSFKKAGEEFVLTAAAVQWKDTKLSQDADKNGIPDDFNAISDNDIAKHFDNQKIGVDMDLVLPNDRDKSLGDLIVKTANKFVDSTVDNTYAYSEVGIIKLNAILPGGNYLGAGIDGSIQGQITNVGRFTPDHFELTLVDDGSFGSVCERMPFVYSGQMSSEKLPKGALQYSDQPRLRITAKSSICPNNTCGTTLNYRGAFMKLTSAGINRQKADVYGSTAYLPIEDASMDGVDASTKVRLTASYTKGELTEDSSLNYGALIFSYSTDDHFVYLHEQNSEIPPFTADINLNIASIIDADSIAAYDADDDLTVLPAIITPKSIFTFHPQGKEVRFGRAVIENSFGPETSNLPQPLHLQFLSALGDYVASSDDNCTLWDSDNITLTDITLDKSKTKNLGGTGSLKGGSTRSIYLQAPKDAKGKVGVEYTVAPWLKYDWAYDKEGVDGLFNDNPSAVATFGAFRGNDRIIYRRETAH